MDKWTYFNNKIMAKIARYKAKQLYLSLWSISENTKINMAMIIINFGTVVMSTA